eukprot:6564889-Pyramimonas_sp.AAC.1
MATTTLSSKSVDIMRAEVRIDGVEATVCAQLIVHAFPWIVLQLRKAFGPYPLTDHTANMCIAMYKHDLGIPLFGKPLKS